MGLSTALGVARRGYFIPHRYAGDLPPRPSYGAYPEIESILDTRRAVFEAHLERIDDHATDLLAIGVDDPPQPRWSQGWFPRLDAAAAYAMIRDRRPGRVVEVGSGHSTRFMARAARDAGAEVAFTCIDPAPRADLSGLGVAHVRATVQAAGLDPFRQLTPGDVLFIDSSHILVPGSDADLLINRVWPTLPVGTIVHFHDVFLPDDYPEEWSWRGYNEQSGVAALLAAGGAEILFAGRFAATRMTAELSHTVIPKLPLIDGAVETSLWLEKSGGPVCAP